MGNCHFYFVSFDTDLAQGVRVPRKKNMIAKMNDILYQSAEKSFVDYLGIAEIRTKITKLEGGKRRVNWLIVAVGLFEREYVEEYINAGALSCPQEEAGPRQVSNDSQVALPGNWVQAHKTFDLEVSKYLSDAIRQNIPAAPRDISLLVREVPYDERAEKFVHKEAFEKRHEELVYSGETSSFYKSYILLHKETEPGEAQQQLKELVGIKDVKSKLEDIIASVAMMAKRRKLGLGAAPFNLHMLFTGNPGTAKTTVARLLGPILAGRGVLQSPKVVECSRADLVGRYVGETAIKVKEKFEEAYGGILFIDEAYSLIGDSQDFGPEAITTIVSEMENNRDNTMVIFAGYPEKMEEFLNINVGLRSRIAFRLHFPDYTTEELTEIVEQMARKYDYVLSSAAKSRVMELIRRARSQADFGNGRFARNLFEQAAMHQAKRLENEDTDRTKMELLEAEDFAVTGLNLSQKKAVRPLGFALG